MTNRRVAMLVLAIAGLVLLILSLTADWTGIGRQPGFGVSQLVGTLLGLVAAAAAGVILYRRQGK